MIITKRHIRTAKLILEGKLTYEEIAKEIGICEKTLYNWLNDDDFKKLLDQMANEYRERAIRFLKGKSMGWPFCGGKVIHEVLRESQQWKIARRTIEEIAATGKTDSGGGKRGCHL